MKRDKGVSGTALVTGATGFIGMNLVFRLISSDWNASAIVRPTSELERFDPIQDVITIHTHDGTAEGMTDIIRAAKPDIVFHLASSFVDIHAPSDISSLILSNITFATQLVDSMTTLGIDRLVNTGTSWQHYENADYNPANLYAATKHAFESILNFYMETSGMNTVTLVLFDTYGPNDPRPKLMNLLARSARDREPVSMSPGEQLIDLVYIDDVVEAYLLAAKRLMAHEVVGHERYAVSSGSPVRLKDLIRIYEEATNSNVPILWGNREYREREVMVPWDRGRALPDWKPKVSLEEGIRRIT